MIAMNEILNRYGYEQWHLVLFKELKEKAEGDALDDYWVRAYRFVDGITLLPQLSIKQSEWLFEILRQLNNQCEYKCPYHQGPVEWHHPIGGAGSVIASNIGLRLCQAHHSLLYGRKVKYTWELGLNKTLDEMRGELKELESSRIKEFGLSPQLVNKR